MKEAMFVRGWLCVWINSTHQSQLKRQHPQSKVPQADQVSRFWLQGTSPTLQPEPAAGLSLRLHPIIDGIINRRPTTNICLCAAAIACGCLDGWLAGHLLIQGTCNPLVPTATSCFVSSQMFKQMYSITEK